MLRLSPFITVYCCAVAALLGACTGSFLACLAWRTVHGESVLRGRSHCDVCGHVLGVRDLVPVFSYLLSGRQVPLLRRKALRPPCVGGADLCGGVRELAAPI